MTIKIKFITSFFLFLCSSSVFSGADGDAKYIDIVGCMLEPSTLVDVSSQVPGVVEFMPVKLGDKVAKGQKLFSLKSGVEAASVELAVVREEFSQRKVERNEEMYKEELISIHEKDEFLTEYHVAKKERKYAEQVLDLRQVNSPIKGVVVDRFYDPGEFVNTEPLLKIAGLDPLKVELVMSIASFGFFDGKTWLLVFPDAPIGGEYQAKISIVDPIIDAASGTFRVIAELNNKDGSIPSGVECRIGMVESNESPDSYEYEKFSGDPEKLTRYKARASLNYRKHPNVNAAKLGLLAAGVKFTAVRDPSSGWLIIFKENKRIGYVSGDDNHVELVGAP